MANDFDCPCGSKKLYTDCCGRYLDNNEILPRTAEELMRSRYTAYVLRRESYLLSTWHDETRPVALDLADDNKTKWIRLEVIKHVQCDDDHAVVEFIAYYKINGRMHKLRENSQFVRINSCWFYFGALNN